MRDFIAREFSLREDETKHDSQRFFYNFNF